MLISILVQIGLSSTSMALSCGYLEPIVMPALEGRLIYIDFRPNQVLYFFAVQRSWGSSIASGPVAIASSLGMNGHRWKVDEIYVVPGRADTTDVQNLPDCSAAGRSTDHQEDIHDLGPATAQASLQPQDLARYRDQLEARFALERSCSSVAFSDEKFPIGRGRRRSFVLDSKSVEVVSGISGVAWFEQGIQNARGSRSEPPRVSSLITNPSNCWLRVTLTSGSHRTRWAADCWWVPPHHGFPQDRTTKLVGWDPDAFEASVAFTFAASSSRTDSCSQGKR